ncbi:hypothetical protein [Serratia fonticola]|uniref:hypothetical protein n=1 Tax=Serratia fonticola TaxID=47917 RepID=UPI0013784A50|nr:hypothetical protein [Serratia fonticola]NCG51576.1 hypothetical protein [Serratia fonticola]
MSKRKNHRHTKKSSSSTFEKKQLTLQTISVVMAMFLFMANIGWSFIQAHIEKENKLYNIRTVLAYEIYNNKKSIELIYKVRNIREYPTDDGEDTEEHPIYLDKYAKIKLSFLSSIDDKVFKIYNDKIDILSPDEVSLIMDYYSTLTNLKNRISETTLTLNKSIAKKQVEHAEYELNDVYMRIFELSDKLTSRYKNYTPKSSVDDLPCESLLCMESR